MPNKVAEVVYLNGYKQKWGMSMSDTNRTIEEYIERYARDRKISIEEAKSHAIVRAVIEEKQSE